MWHTSGVSENFFKKGIDKEGEVCYLMQAVREGGGKIPGSALEVGKARKDFQRKSKKGLTNGWKSAILTLVPLTRRVPCKLNNVTKRKHHTNTVLWNFDEASGRTALERTWERVSKSSGGGIESIARRWNRTGFRRRERVQNEAMENSSIKVEAIRKRVVLIPFY